MTSHLSRTRCLLRPFSSGATSLAKSVRSNYIVFDSKVKEWQRSVSARDKEKGREVDYLRDAVAEDVADRIMDIKRRYPTITEIGSGAGHLVKFLNSEMTDRLVMCDRSVEMLHRDSDLQPEVPVTRIHLDQDYSTFEDDSLDIIVSSMSLHWENDLQGALATFTKKLKPDGVFIGAMLGGDTLFELRCSLQLAEMERQSGLSPHVSPMANPSEIGSLLSTAGLNLVTVDVSELTINYPTIFDLMSDLKAMGENNASLSRPAILGRDVIIAAESIYREIYGNKDGHLPATFQIVHMIGWKPDLSQRAPLERGSAKTSLKTTLEAT